MQDGLENLTQEEREILYDAIPLITVLIASADGVFDEDEAEMAKKIVRIREYTHHHHLGDYYKQVGKRFSMSMDRYLKTSPYNTEARIDHLSDELKKVNPVMDNVDPDVAAILYEDFLSFAKHVAKSTGGFFKMGAITPKEEELMHLRMLDPKL